MVYLNTRYTPFFPESDKWYNLDTGHYLKDSSKKLVLKNLRVVSTNFKVLREFIVINQLNISEIEADSTIIQSLIKLENNKEMETTTQLTADLADKLDLLTFAPKKILVEGLVTDVTDGDTVKILVKLPLDKLADKNFSKGAQCSISIPGVIMTFRINCRLFGIDAAEKDTKKGILIKQVLIDICQRYNNIVLVQTMGVGAHNRTIVRLYPIHVPDFCINDYLLNYVDQTWGKLAIEYYGTSSDKHKEFKKNSNQPDDPIPEMKPIFLPDPISSVEISKNTSEDTSEDTPKCQCVIM